MVAVPPIASAGLLSSVEAASGSRVFEGIAYNPQTLEVIGSAAVESEIGRSSVDGKLVVGSEEYTLGNAHAHPDEAVTERATSPLEIDVTHRGTIAGELILTDDKMSGVILPVDQHEIPGEITNQIAFSLVDQRQGSYDDQLAALERVKGGL